MSYEETMMSRVTSGWGDAGGIVGANSGLVEYSYFSGSVLSESFVGGIAGSNAGILRTSYASGSIFGRWGLGGIMGENGTSFFSKAHAENCFFDVQATGRMGGSPRGEKDGTMIGMIPSDVGWMDRQNFEESKWFITVNTYPQLRIMAKSDNDDLRMMVRFDVAAVAEFSRFCNTRSEDIHGVNIRCQLLHTWDRCV